MQNNSYTINQSINQTINQSINQSIISVCEFLEINLIKSGGRFWKQQTTQTLLVIILLNYESNGNTFNNSYLWLMEKVYA